MTQGEKDLLLKDLCARLPYNTMVFVHDLDVEDYDTYIHPDIIANLLVNRIWKVKPYLRPMSSMTEEEKDTYDTMVMSNASWVVDDWLNAHYLDYRDLIGKGLALEAPTDMYN